MRTIRICRAAFAAFGVGCGDWDSGGAPADDDRSWANDDSPQDDDAGEDDAAPDDDTTAPPSPAWECAKGITAALYPDPVATGGVLHLDFTQHTGASGHVYVDLAGLDPAGSPVQGQLDSITGTGPWTWWYSFTPLLPGRYDWTFTADSGATWLCSAQSWVEEGAGDDDTPPDDVADPPPDNPFGIGLVSEGDASQWDRARELAGRGGHVKLVFAGVTPGMASPPESWRAAIEAVYARDLVPVVRMGPPWGDMGIRDRSDDGAHLQYTSYGHAYAAVVAGLPRRDGWPLWIEVHNEPDLCYEWTCGAGEGWLDYHQTAAEYASFLRDVTAALRALGDDRVRVLNAGYAPGGAASCECGGSGYTGGITSRDFVAAMEAAVPGVHAALDGFATHSYPSRGEGWGFFPPYDEAGPGLHTFEGELATLGLSLPVFITETGWTIASGDCPGGVCGSREDVAAWTLSAWQADWWPETRVAAVMPFMLRDPAWDSFAWVDGGDVPYPVFTSVRDWRCGMSFPEPC